MERTEGQVRWVPATFDILGACTPPGTTLSSGVICAGTPGLSGDWYRIQYVGDPKFYDAYDCIINGATRNLSVLSSDNIEMPTGTFIYGKFEHITLYGGMLLAYRD